MKPLPSDRVKLSQQEMGVIGCLFGMSGPLIISQTVNIQQNHCPILHIIPDRDLEAGKRTLRLKNVLWVIDALGREIQLSGLPVIAADQRIKCVADKAVLFTK